ncbi:hypothetical protein LXL04_010727 [Taraxacum kok-saghyz]
MVAAMEKNGTRREETWVGIGYSKLEYTKVGGSGVALPLAFGLTNTRQTPPCKVAFAFAELNSLISQRARQACVLISNGSPTAICQLNANL